MPECGKCRKSASARDFTRCFGKCKQNFHVTCVDWNFEKWFKFFKDCPYAKFVCMDCQEQVNDCLHENFNKVLTVFNELKEGFATNTMHVEAQINQLKLLVSNKDNNIKKYNKALPVAELLVDTMFADNEASSALLSNENNGANQQEVIISTNVTDNKNNVQNNGEQDIISINNHDSNSNRNSNNCNNNSSNSTNNKKNSNKNNNSSKRFGHFKNRTTSRRVEIPIANTSEKSSVVIGTGDSNITMATVEPRKWIFISRLSNTVTDHHFKEYVRLNLNITDVNCTRIVPRQRSGEEVGYISYKLNVPESEFDRLLQPQSWPKGVLVKEFSNSRSKKFFRNARTRLATMK